MSLDGFHLADVSSLYLITSQVIIYTRTAEYFANVFVCSISHHHEWVPAQKYFNQAESRAIPAQLEKV